MSYESLFDKLRHLDNLMMPLWSIAVQEYTLNDVLSGLEMTMNEDDTADSITKRILFPSMIVSSLLDHKIASKYNTEMRRLFQDSVGMALQVYAQDDNAHNTLRDIANRIYEYDNGSLGLKHIRRHPDNYWIESSEPERNHSTAMSLHSMAKGVPIFFISIAHESHCAGMDIFLRYDDMTGHLSDYYPVRLSTRKWRDGGLRLSLAEAIMIKEHSENKIPVLFDIFRTTGRTLDIAQANYEKMCPDKQPIVICNNDNRQEYRDYVMQLS